MKELNHVLMGECEFQNKKKIVYILQFWRSGNLGIRERGVLKKKFSK